MRVDFVIFRLMIKNAAVRKLFKGGNMLIHEALGLKHWCPSAWRKSAKQTEAEH